MAQDHPAVRNWKVAISEVRSVANIIAEAELSQRLRQEGVRSKAENYDTLCYLRQELWEVLEDYLDSPDELFFGCTGILVDGP